jgi:hypothetical protein
MELYYSIGVVSDYFISDLSFHNSSSVENDTKSICCAYHISRVPMDSKDFPSVFDGRIDNVSVRVKVYLVVLRSDKGQPFKLIDAKAHQANRFIQKISLSPAYQ